MKRKRKQQLISASPQAKAKQSKLNISPSRLLKDEDVDNAWGRAFFGLDMAPNKASNELFREAICATKRSSISYKGPTRQKLLGPVLDRLHKDCMQVQKKFLTQNTGYGRAITGDGAKVLGTKFINFLCHEKGKGVMLLKIKDCSERLSEVGTIQVTFIAHELIKVVKYVGPQSVYLVIVDGGADWVVAQEMVREQFPWIQFIHCVAHEASLIIKDIFSVDEVCDNRYIYFLITFIIPTSLTFIHVDLRPGTLDHRCAEVVYDIQTRTSPAKVL